MSRKQDEIVFAEGNTVYFCDYHGNIKNKIRLRYDIKDFKLKGRNICFVDANEKIRLLNIDNLKEEKVPEGPFFYKKTMVLNNIHMETGKEIVRDVDFSIEKKWIVCVCRPDYAINTYKDGVVKRWIGEDYQEFSNSILIDYNSGKINTKISQTEDGDYGYCEKPLIYRSSVIFNSGPSLIYLDLDKKFEFNFEKTFIKYFQLEADSEALYNLNISKDKFAFIRINFINKIYKVENAYPEIYSYDFINNKFNKIKEFKDFIKIDGPYNRILDISSDYKHILMNEGNDMYLVDLKDLKKKLIYKFEKVLYKAQFYCD
jgi:hypothetical protein